MKARAAIIAAILLATCINAWPAADNIDQVVLLDVQGLRGGANLWISGDGKATCCLVTPPRKGGSGLQEICYSPGLTGEQQEAISHLLQKHDFFQIKTDNRYGVPDEARPVIFVKSGDRKRAVAKWAGDKNKQFDPIYKYLLHMARPGKDGTEIRKGAFDRDWKPEGFPENMAIFDMTKPDPYRK